MYTTRTALKAAAFAASKTAEGRYALACVQVDATGACTATDGSVMVRIIPNELDQTGAELPVVLANGYHEGPVLVPVPAIKTIQAVKGCKHLRDVSEAVAVTPEAVAVLNDSLQAIACPITVEGVFPAIDRVIPQPKADDISICFGADKLAILANAAKAIGALGLTFTFHNDKHLDTTQAKVTATAYGMTLLAVVMPMRQ